MDFMLFDFLIKLVYAVVAVMFMRYFLKYRDKYLLGIDDFKQAFEPIKNDPKAFSLYLSAWIIALGFIVGNLF